MTPKWRNRLLNLSLLVASLLLCFALLEVSARLYEYFAPRRTMATQAHTPPTSGKYGNIIEPADWDTDIYPESYVTVEDSELVYRLRPGAVLSPTVRTNAAGYRDSEFSTHKPANVYRIAAVGDSVVFGLLVRERESFTEVLERMLNSYADGDSRFEVYNMGVKGYDIPQEVEVVRSDVFQYQPDLVLIGYCANDAYIFPARDLGLRLENRRRWLRGMGLLRQVAQKAYYTFAGDMIAEGYGAMARLCGEQGAHALVTLFPPAGPTAVLDLVEAKCRALGMLTVNLMDAYTTIGSSALLLDDVHPTAFGHRIAAEEVLLFLRNAPESGLRGMSWKPLPDFGAVRDAFVAGETALGEQRVTDAVAQFKQVVQMAPLYDDLVGLLLRGESDRLMRAGDLDAAFTLAEAAAACAPDHVEVLVHFSEICERQGRLEQAVALAREAREQAADQSNKGAAERRYPPAIDCVAASRDRLAQALLALGQAALQQEAYPEALAQFREGAALSTAQEAELRYGEMQALSLMGQADAARDGMLELLERQPGGFYPYGLLYDVLNRHYPSIERRRIWARLAESHPDSPYPPLFLGHLEMERGEAETALGCYERGLAIAPGVAALHSARAQSLLVLGHVDHALASFEEALRLDPCDKSAAEQLAVALLGMRREQEAFSHFRDSRMRYLELCSGRAPEVLQPGASGGCTEPDIEILLEFSDICVRHNHREAALVAAERADQCARRAGTALRADLVERIQALRIPAP